MFPHHIRYLKTKIYQSLLESNFQMFLRDEKPEFVTSCLPVFKEKLESYKIANVDMLISEKHAVC